jgi:hypothetical protein
MYMENGVNVYNQSGVLGAAFLALLAMGEVVWDDLGSFSFSKLSIYPSHESELFLLCSNSKRIFSSFRFFLSSCSRLLTVAGIL